MDDKYIVVPHVSRPSNNEQIYRKFEIILKCHKHSHVSDLLYRSRNMYKLLIFFLPHERGQLYIGPLPLQTG